MYGERNTLTTALVIYNSECGNFNETDDDDNGTKRKHTHTHRLHHFVPDIENENDENVIFDYFPGRRFSRPFRGV